MFGFIMFISFLIHALTLTALYVLYQQVKKGNSAQIKEIDALMHRYMEQLREENAVLQQALRVQTKDTNDESFTADTINTQVEPGKQEVSKVTSDGWNVEDVMQKEEDSVETSLESRVLQLYRAGIPVDLIAKQLHCGKTEASLIIQFHERK